MAASQSPPSGSSSPTTRTWQALEAMRDRFVPRPRDLPAKAGEHVRVRAGKEFVVRLHSYGATSGSTTRGSGRRVHRLLDLANTYLEMWSKLEYLDVWYSVPQPADAERGSRSAGIATTTTSTS